VDGRATGIWIQRELGAQICPLLLCGWGLTILKVEVPTAEIVGCHPSTVGKAVKRLKLTHSNETIERLKKNSLANLKKAYEKATISKRVKSWQRTMQMEKFSI
jgi:hypothetical protein